MDTRQDILTEIKEICPAIAAVGNANIYAIPQNYFSEFPGKVLSLIKEKDISLPQNIANPFTLPQGYFEGFAASVLSKIKTEEQISPNEFYLELEAVAPLLNKISKENVYAVPANYFEHFKVDLPQAVHAPAKVISIGSKWRRIASYAAAAMIAGISAFGVLVHSLGKSDRSKMPVLNYAQINAINVDESISKMSDAEISSFLQSSKNDIVLPSQPEQDTDILQDDIKNSSDDELQDYLNSNSAPGEKNDAQGI
jgi:hypothetical protein